MKGKFALVTLIIVTLLLSFVGSSTIPAWAQSGFKGYNVLILVNGKNAAQIKAELLAKGVPENAANSAVGRIQSRQQATQKGTVSPLVINQINTMLSCYAGEEAEAAFYTGPSLVNSKFYATGPYPILAQTGTCPANQAPCFWYHLAGGDPQTAIYQHNAIVFDTYIYYDYNPPWFYGARCI